MTTQPTRPINSRAAPAFSVAALGVFFLLVLDLLLHGPITTADPLSSNWLHHQQHAALTIAMRALSSMHSTLGLIALTAALAIGLIGARRMRDAIALVVTVQGAQILNVLAKQVFRRPRPHFDDPLVTLSTLSFPSGHAVGSTALWGFLCLLVLRSRAPPAAKLAFTVLAVALVAATCFSRVYLGAHYLADVLAGVALGLAWLFAWQRAFGPAPSSSA